MWWKAPSNNGTFADSWPGFTIICIDVSHHLVHLLNMMCRAISGGEYQVATTLLSSADVQAAADAAIPLAALPRMTLPFGHPPAGSAGVEKTAAANLKALGLCSSSMLAKAPLQPPPGEWTRYSCR
jgi:hypothetical protein